ncbi:MAG: C25 family cysteine peptidase [Planctomycetota bacterium]
MVVRESVAIARPWAGAVACVLWMSAGVLGAPGDLAQVSVLANDPGRIVVECRVTDYKPVPVVIDGRTWHELSVPGSAPLLRAGAPEVPHVARSIIIPDRGGMTVQVLTAQYRDIAGFDLAPSKGNLLRGITVNGQTIPLDPADVPYAFGAEYTQDAFFPGPLAAGQEPYVLRSRRGMVIDFFPFQYNAATRTLRVYETLTVAVTPNGAPSANELPAGRSNARPSRPFSDLYAAHFLNYEPDVDYNPLEETGEMLVICYDAWLPNMQAFVAHKTSVGMPTTIVGVSTIGNTATTIKTYVQNYYNAHNVAFLLLVGDAAQVATPTVSGGASDPSYAKLAGADNYPDIMVGRFSAETAAHVDLQALKAVRYEQEQWVLRPWFKQATGIASAEGAGRGDEGQADYVHMDEIRTWLMGNGSYTLVDQIYANNGGTAAMVTNALNAGRGLVNYCGHGSSTSWVTTGFNVANVNALANDNLLPVICSVACVNGNFTGQTCFAEAWLRAARNGEPTGAVAAYMSSIDQSWAPPMEGQDEFNLLLSTREPSDYHCFGTLCFAGSCSMMDQYGSAGVSMFDTWHVFGDPSLRVVGTAQPPTGLSVLPGGGLRSEGPRGGPFTPDQLEYTLKNYDPTPLDYSVTRTADWLTVSNAVGTIPAGQTVSVVVSINATANALPDGSYTDVVTFTNTTNHVGDTTRPAELRVGVPVRQHFWDLQTDPGWTTQGQWAWGRPAGLGGDHGGPDPTSGCTGPNVYGYNLNGGYTNYMPEYSLTTAAINCSQLTETSLRFQRWLGVEQSMYDHARVQISANGSTWTTLWENPTTTLDDQAWVPIQIDIAQYADRQPAVYIRWTMGTTDQSWTYCGWNIDDVAIWGRIEFRPGDLNCDAAVNFDDINPFVLALSDPAGYQAAYPNCNILNADCNADGRVDFDDINPFVALLSG